MEDINANSNTELVRALKSIDITVPPRTEGRTTEDCERWSICRFLSTLNAVGEIEFPLRVSKREKPDFQLCTSAIAWGVEVTEAIPTDFARASALAAQEKPDALIDISLFKYGETKTLDEIRNILKQKKLTGEGWAGDSAERELANAVRSVTDSKTAKLRRQDFDKYPRNILLVYDNMPLPHLNHDTVAVHYVNRLKDYWVEGLHFDAIVLESRDTMFLLESSGIRKLQISDVSRDA